MFDESDSGHLLLWVGAPPEQKVHKNRLLNYKGTMSLVENRALVEVRATSGVTLLPRGTTARPSRISSKKQELNPDSHATESATGCLPATSSVRQRWPLAGKVLGGITAQRAR